MVKWLHRFGRRVSERVRCWEELDALGVPIHSVVAGGVVLEVVANILASIAQDEIAADRRARLQHLASRHVAGMGEDRPCALRLSSTNSNGNRARR